jgi:pyruvate-formate lyase
MATTTQTDPRILAGLGEHLAAGYFEMPEASEVRRLSRGLRRHLEQVPPGSPAGPLYPSGPSVWWPTDRAVTFHYSSGLSFNTGTIDRLMESTEDDASASTLAGLKAVGAHGRAPRQYRIGSEIPPEYHLGGGGYTHSIPHFGRIAREGLNGYADRIASRLAEARQAGEDAKIEFYESMEDILAGIRSLHARCLQSIDRLQSQDSEITKLRCALERVPFQPATTFYEAIVCANFIYYLDGCDSMGRIDQDLGPYYERDLVGQHGRAPLMTEDEGVGLVRCLWENINANSGWNVAIGGTTPEGTPAYNALTDACLKAARGIRRPNLALRVRKDTPDRVLDLALEAIASGCGIPALYNEEAYLEALASSDLGLTKDDLPDFAFGGCTETMLHGRSNVGSLDAGINLLQAFEGSLDRHLLTADSFQDLLDGYTLDLRTAIRELTDGVNRDQRMKAAHKPQPIRSLLIDDCIDQAEEYNSGGARYNWSVINVGGLANVIDSLSAIRELIYDRREVTAAELTVALKENLDGHDRLKSRLESCPRFGNDHGPTDRLAADLSDCIFSEFRKHTPWRGGRFLPGCLMFVTFAGAGEHVGATPDGRLAGSPIADSAGPVQGRDRTGPTAMLRSVTRIKHLLAPGTLVVNARFTKSMFESPEGRAKLKDLVRTYFDLGGMQIQINVVDQAVLQDALAHPERHEDLIVRIGGYSEYFNRLTPALKRAVLERTEHS